MESADRTGPVHYRTAVAGGVDVFYREAGPDSGPVVLLLHGFPSSSRMFRDLIPRLSDAYRVIAPDYPAFGHSAVPGRPEFGYTFDHLAGVDEQAEQPAGIITEADIAQAVADGKDVNDVRIRALITTHPAVINAGTSIRDAARSMVTGHFRHLPVAGEAGLIGMADITDACAALPGPPQDDLLASRDRHTPGRPGRDRTHRTSGQERRYAR